MPVVNRDFENFYRGMPRKIVLDLEGKRADRAQKKAAAKRPPSSPRSVSGEALVFQDFDERLAKARRRRRNANAGGLHGSDLGFRITLAA